MNIIIVPLGYLLEFHHIVHGSEQQSHSVFFSTCYEQHFSFLVGPTSLTVLGQTQGVLDHCLGSMMDVA
jgi:hypothetical protein